MHLAKFIDHTLLRADATAADILRLCEEALTHGFHSVCVHGSWVSLASAKLQGTPVSVAAVTGFPLGAMATEAKEFETHWAVNQGAGEIDTVIAVGHLKTGNDAYVREEMDKIVRAAEGRTVKVILETCLLNNDEIVRACEMAAQTGVHFVKTSTGFSMGGATMEHVQLMKQTVRGRCQIKASGGIRDRATALAFIEAGATRLGTSSGISILAGESASQSY